MPSEATHYDCAACEDSGEVAPDAFGPGEPWPKYVAAVAKYCRAHGLPERMSSMIHPLPCPACRHEAHAAARRELVSR
jgi:hypothetical protein